MTPEPQALQIDIQPFDPKTHDRTVFSCGSNRIDNYLKRTAKKHQKDDFARIFVAVLPGTGTVLGYYAINAHAIEVGDLTPEWEGRAPRHGQIPAAYLSIIGVDQSMQGQGLGQVLMVDALKRMIALSDDIGLAVVVLDVLEEGTDKDIQRRAAFYTRIGFKALPSRPYRMIFSIKHIRAALQGHP
jgi:GNAT superfamily N-acetyltransferase